jgi:hypothetical protein
MSTLCWCRKVWRLKSVEPVLDKILSIDNGFWFEPTVVDGEPVLYTMCFERGGMEDCWKGAVFVPKGATDHKLKHLPPMQNPPQGQYDDAVLGILDHIKHNPDLKRLEGVITVNGVPEIVRFFGFAEAQTDKRDWMMIQTVTTAPPAPPAPAHGAAPVAPAPKRQDGTAHGDAW